MTWPATVLRGDAEAGLHEAELAVAWAAWFRFMKSMSMVDQGSRRLAWVCRWSSGLRSASRPEIHILAGGEGVHPRDETDAAVVGVRLQTDPADGGRVGEDRLPDEPHRHLRLVREGVADDP